MHGDNETKKLIEGCLNNDRQSQRALYDKYAPQMYPVCIRYAGNETEAEDILVDAFLNVFTHLKELKKHSSLKSWIYATVVRTSLMHLRAKRQHPFMESFDDMDDSYNCPAPDGEAAIVAKMEAQQAMKIIARLPETQRTIFNMYAIDGFGYKEIAETLEMNESSVRVYYQRARHWILSVMNKQK